MDRVYVSPDVGVLACEHSYDEDVDAGGDRALVLVELQIEQFEQ